MIILFYKNHTYQVPSEVGAFINIDAFIAENKAQAEEIKRLKADKQAEPPTGECECDSSGGIIIKCEKHDSIKQVLKAERINRVVG